LNAFLLHRGVGVALNEKELDRALCGDLITNHHTRPQPLEDDAKDSDLPCCRGEFSFGLMTGWSL